MREMDLTYIKQCGWMAEVSFVWRECDVGVGKGHVCVRECGSED